MTRVILATISLFALFGCTVRTAPPAEPKTPPTKSEKLDKSNVYLAEVNIPMSQLGATLRNVGKFDPHRQWDDAFIKETITGISLLKINDRFEGSFLAKHEDHTAEVKLHIIRIKEDLFSFRAMASHQPIINAIAEAIK